jgi:hypothetical protein
MKSTIKLDFANEEVKNQWYAGRTTTLEAATKISGKINNAAFGALNGKDKQIQRETRQYISILGF